MPKRHVYSKDSTGYGDFIYVDLLPEIRRSRQFNMNVIIALLFAITSIFVLIYIPYSTAVFELENVNSINNDLKHELALTNDEFTGYEIDMDAISFQDDIENLETLRININNIIDDVELIVYQVPNSSVVEVFYNSKSQEIEITVELVQQYNYNTINNQLLNLSWVNYSSYTDPVSYGTAITHTSTYTIGVDYNAE
jgi:hypothetical protein